LEEQGYTQGMEDFMWGTCFFDVWKLMMMRLEPTFGFTNVFHRQKKVK